jgi:hypothetical protein
MAVFYGYDFRAKTQQVTEPGKIYYFMPFNYQNYYLNASLSIASENSMR